MRNNIGLFLTKRAELSPNLEAYVDVAAERRFSFARLNARCNRTAHALHGLGVKKGDRVALLQMNSVEYVESFFAIAKLGAVAVPLNWRLVPEELAFMLKDSGASVLLFGREFADTVIDLHGRGREATDVKEWICVGASENQPGFAKEYDRLRAQASEEEPEIGAADDDELYIMYTSGTTGLPKGAVHTHSTAIWACLTINATADMRYGDRYLVALPLFHVGALTPITLNVYCGVTSVVMRSFDAARTWELIEEERITIMLAVPAMLNFMLQVPEKEKAANAQIRWCMCGAAPVPVTLIESYEKLGIEIHQIYGLTETCGPACLISSEDAMAKAGSTGKAFFHTEVAVVNADGNRVAPGEVGEVLVRGPHIMKAYWNRPEETAEAIRDGWLYSGDLATVDEDGFVYIQDRKKDMIISGGENIYPAEIEDVILALPAVREVAVIGQPSPKWGESPAGIIVKADPSLTPEDVWKHCEDKIARFKIPKVIEFIDEIPRNPTGKVLKRILRERFPGPAPE
ncbi:o-succinylbenzoate--CoA ligase [Candidatus Sumerlaeota bacterium]|nr:o-succinylbenzoate--CoA ligase [Candidatus Sumerlaeota bacterium]